MSPSTDEEAPAKPDRRTSSPPAQQTNTLRPDLPDLANQISDLFVKAANLIGYAMNLDGLTIFDVAATGTQYKSAHLPPRPVDEESSQPVPLEDRSFAKPLSEFREDNTIESLVICRPKQSLIRRLTEAHPQGHLFAIDEYGVLDYGNHPIGEVDQLPNYSSDHKEWEELLDCVPNARYAIFLPLWHYQRETCFATCLAWVTNPSKTLDPGDVNSLTAFGNSVMAEVFRVEALTNTQSKSDFISSISHELRSPLHGILATVDIMQESVTDPHLLSMVDMIESCSSTLLDTFDHLLNFSKINSRASGKGHFDNSGSPHDHTKDDKQSVLVDLGTVVEDVLETVSLGHLSATQMKIGIDSEQRTTTADREREAHSGSVVVTTHIENNRNWTIPFDKGAWKRILLNLCSNALKYTKTGYIDVMLRLVEAADGGLPHISLSVTDTGIGMSPEFLKYHIFTPFMQENNLTPGTGLGLSLVKSIVESIRGKIVVESHLHEGTRLTINVPLDEESEIPDRLNVDTIPKSYDKLRGLSLALLSITSDSDSTQCIVPTPKELQRSIRNICEGKFGMTITQISADIMPNTDFVLVDTHALTSPHTFNPKTLFGKVISHPATSAVLTLGVPIKALTNFFSTNASTSISSPITSKRLAAALLTALTQAQSHTPATKIPPQSPTQEIPTRTKPTKPTLPRVSSHDAKPSFPCRFTHFLLVDDNSINLKVLSAFATRIAVPYVLAHDGAEAVQLYKQAALEGTKPFDCIFMDISMPVMDGFQAAAAIRRFEEETMASTRSFILALTGLGSEGARTSARTSGFDGFMVKPVRFRDMLPLLAVQKSA
jgi:signal transduction histidine kinase/CheY-like chemotaxis protein